MGKPEERIALDKAAIEERMSVLLPRDTSLEEAMRYSLFAGGKRIRPILTLEFCRAAGGRPEDVLDAACGLEMLHTYSLIHDDLPCMDNDDLRRGVPTNHRVYGEWMALLAGDALQAEAFRAVLGSAGMPEERRARAGAALALAAGRLGICGGQYIDLYGEGRSLTREEIMEMYGKKTSALFEAACVMGCIGADASPELTDAARRYGHALGLAFQIRDDLLELESTEAELGKPLGSDERNGKSTLARILGRKAAEETAAACSREALELLERHFGGDECLMSLTRSLTGRRI